MKENAGGGSDMKSSPLQKLKQILLYGGVSRETYRAIRPRINEQNLITLRRGSLLGILIGLFLCVCAESVPVVRPNLRLYLGMTLLLLTYYLLSRLVLELYPKAGLAAWYVLLALAFAYGILVGTVYSPIYYGPATTICVFLFALPLLVVDVPWRMDLLILSASAVFFLLSSRYKTPIAYQMDLVNGGTFTVLSLFVNGVVSRRNMREIEARIMIELERDTDGLTRLLTKSASQIAIHSCLSARRDGCLFMLDADDFKVLNDTCGHAYGDAALINIGRCLRETFRQTDIIGRFGGDEFLVFMLDAGVDAARQKCAALYGALERAFPPDGTAPPLTCSIGIAAVRPGESYDALFQRADAALYRSKRGGKNQYTVAE